MILHILLFQIWFQTSLTIQFTALNQLYKKYDNTVTYKALSLASIVPPVLHLCCINSDDGLHHEGQNSKGVAV